MNLNIDLKNADWKIYNIDCIQFVNHPQAEDLWACHEQLSP